MQVLSSDVQCYGPQSFMIQPEQIAHIKPHHTTHQVAPYSINHHGALLISDNSFYTLINTPLVRYFPVEIDGAACSVWIATLYFGIDQYIAAAHCPSDWTYCVIGFAVPANHKVISLCRRWLSDT